MYIILLLALSSAGIQLSFRWMASAIKYFCSCHVCISSPDMFLFLTSSGNNLLLLLTVNLEINREPLLR